MLKLVGALFLLLACAPKAGASEFARLAAVAEAQNDSRAVILTLIKAIDAWEPPDGKDSLAKICGRLGRNLVITGDYKEAETFFARAVSLSPNDAGYRIGRTFTLLLLGRVDESIGEALTVYRMNPRETGNLMNLCGALLQAEEFERARPYCLEVTRLAPDDYQGFMGMATVLAELGRHQEAAKMLAEAKTKPSSPMLRSEDSFSMDMRAREAYIVSLGGRWDDGERIFQELIQRLPTEPSFYAGRGLARLRRGRYDAAIADFDAAYALKPAEVIRVLHQRANANQKAGRPALAAEDRIKACRAGWAAACLKKKRKARE